ncbi:formate/nitrite transporter family protein, partial [Vogesella oryzae]|uniref:formate/nitrite transporter family protein n=1 Tax=Vogesella oryzae TaxID=1735285 RepID=UPI00158209D6
AWADRRISHGELLRNWSVVCAANFAGAAGMALLVWLSGHPGMNQGRVAVIVVQLASAKCAAPLATLFWKGVLCNILVCLAVWMSLAGRSVTDKFIAIVFPVSAFVAAGFEHSIANMYLIPLALLLRDSVPPELVSPALGVLGMLRNLLVVIAGNILGGSVLVALVYYLIYRRAPRPH